MSALEMCFRRTVMNHESLNENVIYYVYQGYTTQKCQILRKFSENGKIRQDFRKISYHTKNFIIQFNTRSKSNMFWCLAPWIYLHFITNSQQIPSLLLKSFISFRKLYTKCLIEYICCVTPSIGFTIYQNQYFIPLKAYLKL